jgi:TonB family C-terminal domain
MSKIDLTSLEWRELVFQGKNKEYGAYELRSGSDKRHNRAMIIIAIVAVVGFMIPKVIDFIESRRKVQVVEYGPNQMSKLPPAKVNDEHIKKVQSTEPPPALKTSVKFTAPVIKKDEEVSDKDEMKSQEELTNTKGIISIADVKGNDDVNGKDIADVKADVTQVAEEPVLEVVEQMPTFPGGESELLAYIGKNLKYPVIAQENGIQGTVIVRFVVSKTGDVEKVEVLRSLDAACDKEAKRVVSSLPRWIPGRQNGANVAVYYTLPIKYKLE